MARLQELADRMEILDCLQRYARGIDRQDRDLLRSAYHDDAIDDHAGFVGNVDDFIDWALSYHSTQTRYQHYLMNHTVELARDEAHTETYYLFIGTDRDREKPLTITGGRYVDRFERRENRWAIAARVCLVEWSTYGPSAMTPEIIEFLAPLQTIAHDISDASYDRPLAIKRM
ncbi:nuclear transport factor 2 family protein [Mycobacterium sp. NPDC051804]|uniref:nuclear transport factor 2 family protein n=1 Tax=Mycobacterium sp. NPDC051804 TaxID=3364295 RepID=UPI0037A32F1F